MFHVFHTFTFISMQHVSLLVHLGVLCMGAPSASAVVGVRNAQESKRYSQLTLRACHIISLPSFPCPTPREIRSEVVISGQYGKLPSVGGGHLWPVVVVLVGVHRPLLFE